MNLSEQTFPGHDPETWVCVRCGLMSQKQFSWAHRPITNPGLRTCGGAVVPARLYHHCRELINAYWLRMTNHMYAMESGNTTFTGGGGAYGIPQTLEEGS